MAKLPRYTATTPPSKGAGAARATDIRALIPDTGAEFRALGQVGQALESASSFGYRAYMGKKEIDRHVQYSEFTKDSKTYMTEMEAMMETMNFQSVDDQRAFLRDFEDEFTKYIDKRINQTSDAVLKGRMVSYKNDALPVAVDWARQKSSSKLRNYSLARTEENIKALASNGDVELAQKEIQFALSSGLADERWAIKQKEVIEEQRLLTVINYAASTLLPDDIEKAGKMIDESKEFNTEQEKQVFRNQLKSVVRNARMAQNAQIEANDAEANKQMTDLMIEDKLTTQEVQSRRTMLKSNSYKSWAKAAISSYATEDNDAIARTIDTAIVQLHNGIGTESEIFGMLAANKENLTKETFTALRNRIPEAYEDYINTIVESNHNYILGQILHRDPISQRWTGTAKEERRAKLAVMDYHSMVRTAREAKAELTDEKLFDFAETAVALHPKAMTEEARNKWEFARKEMEEILKMKPAPKSPYPEYPDAYQVDGKWYVDREGRTFEIKL